MSDSEVHNPLDAEDVETEEVETEIVDAALPAKIAAPLIALAATWAVREVLERVYKKTTGHEPPHASDPDQALHRVLLWAAATAAAMAAVSVVVDRMAAPKRVETES